MAEFGAHITGTVEADAPSIFEVLAQENLISSLRPALKYAFKVIAQNYPAKCGWLHMYGDEVYLLLDLCLENYYLKNYSASFAENFYGLKRVLQNTSLKLMCDSPLPRITHNKSLLFLVLVPYLQHKCDQLYENLNDEQHRGRTHSVTWKHKLIKAFLAAYPYIYSTSQAIHFITQLAYVFGKLRYHSVFLKWAGVRLENLNMEDIDRHQKRNNSSMDLNNKSYTQSLFTVLNKGLSMLAIVISSGLSLSVFFLQFLEWWYSSDTRVTSITTLPVPDPPKESEEVDYFNSTICQLCNKPRTNHTALAVSGYVFCYPCIYKYVRQHRQCPVTKYPCTLDHLVRLHQPYDVHDT